jgi:hypothetical protein
VSVLKQEFCKLPELFLSLVPSLGTANIDPVYENTLCFLASCWRHELPPHPLSFWIKQGLGDHAGFPHFADEFDFEFSGVNQVHRDVALGQ